MIDREHMRAIGVALVALTILVTGGCTGSEPPADAGPSTSPAESVPATGTGAEPTATSLPEGGQPLTPGRYMRDGFTPAVEFEVGAGWVAEQRASGFFDVEQDVGSLDVIAVQFAQVTGFATAAAAAASFARALQVSQPVVDSITIA